MKLSVIWTETTYHGAEIEVPDDHDLDDATILALAVKVGDPEPELASRKLDGYEQS